MSFIATHNFRAAGRLFYVLIGDKILPGGKIPVGFAIRHDSASAPDFDYHALALQRLESGKYKYPLTCLNGRFRILYPEDFAHKMTAWLESEGTIARPGSVRDIIRRGETFVNYAPASDAPDFEAVMGRSKYVTWRTEAVKLVARLPEGEPRRSRLLELLERLPGPVHTPESKSPETNTEGSAADETSTQAALETV